MYSALLNTTSSPFTFAFRADKLINIKSRDLRPFSLTDRRGQYDVVPIDDTSARKRSGAVRNCR